jgi:hypothetical protein
MQVLSHDELKSLAANQNAASVSIYLPTHRTNPEAQQDPIRLRNLLGEAEKRLAANGLRSGDARRLVAQAETLVPRHNFAQQGSAGLAVFLAPDVFKHYWLPFAVEERLNLGHRFHLKPLLPSLAPDGVFYVLALSQNQVRLLEGTRHSVREVELAGVPQSAAEALQFDEHENQVQFHTGTRAPGGQGGERPGVFHGSSGANEAHNSDLRRFFHQVDEGVRAWLGPRTAPLLLAGVEYLHPLYRAANEYPHLMEGGITGNPEGMRAEDLHAQAWELVRPIITAGREATAERFRELHGAGDKLASVDLNEIVPAAHYGRVESLFVAPSGEAWGRFDPDTNTVVRHAQPENEDDDLYDLAAVQTYLNGGSVYAVTVDKMPGDDPVAALFRY